MKRWLQQLLSCVVTTQGFLLAPGLVLAAALSLPVQAESRIVSLGTGGVTGLYYPTGGALCRLMNRMRNEHGIRCAVRSTPGSVSNLQRVLLGELDMGIAEAGQLYNAVQGRGKFPEPSKNLRTLISLYPEYISVLTRTDSGIRDFSDLRSKRINIGEEGSSQRITLGMLMSERGWALSGFGEVHELEPSGQADALCENRIDATLYVVGHPSGAIKEALRDCDSALISLSAHDVEALIQRNPHYRPQVLSGEFYGEAQVDVETAAVNATLFALDDLPDAVAYALVKSLVSQFEYFQRMHPAFRQLELKDMVHAPLAAPLHPGAEKYFREVGLL